MAFKKGARDAWNATVKAFDSLLVSVMVSSLTFTRGGEPLRTSMTAEQLWRRAPVRY